MRHATIRQMQIFDAVARCLGFSRAADELGLTQPAVSLQIKQIESLAGMALFESVGRQLFLTAAGEALLGHARAILGAVADAEKAMEAIRGGKAGGLRVAVVSTGKYFAPQLLAAFMEGYPGVELSLAVANRQQVLDMLGRNETDLAIMGRPPTDLAVTATPFADHPMVFIAKPGHPLARRKLTMEALASETMLMRESGSGTRILLEALLSDYRLTPRRIEMASNETIKQAVMAGMGISLLSRHTIGLEVSVGRLAILDVADTPVVRQWHVVHRDGKRLLPVAEALIAFLLSQGARRIEETTRAHPPRRRRAAQK